MAITKLKSQYLTFTQPQIGSTVNVRIDGAIDWIFVGGQAFIHNAGLYNVLSKSGQIFELELVIPLKQPETVIHRGFIAPVLYSSDGIPQTEETLYLMNEYDYLELNDENSQADFNAAVDEELMIQQEYIAELQEKTLIMPLSAFDTDIDTGDCQPFTPSFAFQILAAQISVGTAPVGSAIEVGLKKNGTDISPSVRAKIASGDKVSSSPEIVLTADEFAVGDTLQPYIHTVGSTTAGKDLNLILTIKKL